MGCVIGEAGIAVSFRLLQCFLSGPVRQVVTKPLGGHIWPGRFLSKTPAGWSRDARAFNFPPAKRGTRRQRLANVERQRSRALLKTI